MIDVTIITSVTLKNHLYIWMYKYVYRMLLILFFKTRANDRYSSYKRINTEFFHVTQKSYMVLHVISFSYADVIMQKKIEERYDQ